MSRVYETVTVLCLLGTMVLGMTYILSAVLDKQKSSLHTLLSKLRSLSLSLSLNGFPKTYHFLKLLIPRRSLELLPAIFVLLRLFRRRRRAAPYV